MFNNISPILGFECLFNRRNLSSSDDTYCRAIRLYSPISRTHATLGSRFALFRFLHPFRTEYRLTALVTRLALSSINRRFSLRFDTRMVIFISFLSLISRTGRTTATITCSIVVSILFVLQSNAVHLHYLRGQIAPNPVNHALPRMRRKLTYSQLN